MKPQATHRLIVKGPRAYALCTPEVSLTSYTRDRIWASEDNARVTCEGCIALMRGFPLKRWLDNPSGLG